MHAQRYSDRDITLAITYRGKKGRIFEYGRRRSDMCDAIFDRHIVSAKGKGFAAFTLSDCDSDKG